MDIDMELRSSTPPERPRSGNYQVFREPEDHFADEVHRIEFLLNAWLMSRDKSLPTPLGSSRVERKLHDAIKASPLYGKILSFAGLNLWVDDRTSDGLVTIQESINLS
jgi:hypothetical protein